MKIRTDFVTNSSSSSFIIGTKDDKSLTRDVVFRIVRDLFKEEYEKRDKFKLDCYKYGMKWGKNSFIFKKGKPWDSDNKKIDNIIQKKYGLTSWDWYYENDEWVLYNTYHEYQEYWKNVIAKSEDVNIHAPFSIVDFENKDCLDTLFLECGHYGLSNAANNNSIQETMLNVLGWYTNCVPVLLNIEEYDTDCRDCDYCSFDREKCKSFEKDIKEGKITLENAFSVILGKVCIFSECGYIPDNIVEKLVALSTYSCNHMG